MEMQTASASPPELFQKTFYRIDSIDFLRGLVMIIMALDHTRDMFHSQAFTIDPLNLLTTTPLLFVTRWITHFCAPIFVFLSGTSIFLQGLRKTKKELSAFLIKRGLWLTVVEVVIMTLGISFDIQYSLIILQVIWAIGISMILLGLILWLHYKLILTLSILIVLGHNTLDFWEASHSGPYSILYSLLHRQGFYPLSNTQTLGIFYPFLPWTGVMMLGYCFGRLYQKDIHIGKRKKIITVIGVVSILLFGFLRWNGNYGDSLSWSVQKNALFTIFSFINTQKYPPSFLYVCMTLGPAMLFLAWSESARNRLKNTIAVYGRVPFLYYVVHFYLLHGIAAILFLLRGHPWEQGVKGIPNFPFKFIIPGEGYNLGIVYFIWILVVAALYPLCKRFSDYKKKHKKWWLSYL